MFGVFFSLQVSWNGRTPLSAQGWLTELENLIC